MTEGLHSIVAFTGSAVRCAALPKTRTGSHLAGACQSLVWPCIVPGSALWCGESDSRAGQGNGAQEKTDQAFQPPSTLGNFPKCFFLGSVPGLAGFCGPAS